MKTTVHKPYFWKQFESKYSLLDGFVHFSSFLLTLREIVLPVQHSHCLKIQCLNLFFQLVVLFIPGSSPSPYFRPLKSGLVALSAEISQHGVQSVQVHFHPSLSLYFSIRRHHSLQKMERCILSTGIPFSQEFHSTLRCKNCRQQLSSKWKTVTYAVGRYWSAVFT